MTGAPVERSPLDAIHRSLGARMVPFGGWEMPLYSTGISHPPKGTIRAPSAT